MKIIKTSNFLKKEAQFSGDLPGDPSLPPGVTNQMIDKQFDAKDPINYEQQSGMIEPKIDWAKETVELINAGYDVRGLPQRGMGNIAIYYQFDANVYDNEVIIDNLDMLDIKILRGGQYQPLTVAEPSTKEGIFEGYKDEIVEMEKRTILEMNQTDISTETDRREEIY